MCTVTKIKYPNSITGERTGLAFYIMKRNVPFSLQEEIQKRGFWDDLLQEVYSLSWMCQDIQDDKEYMKTIARGIYRFLVNYGFKRPKGSSSYIFAEELRDDIETIF